MKGTVKWFDRKRGYGFIQTAGGEEVFVHHSGIEGEGFKSLPEGAYVDFDVAESVKTRRPQAVNVKVSE